MDRTPIKESIESFLSFVKDQKPSDRTLIDLENLSDHLYEILMQGRRIQDKDLEISLEHVEAESLPYQKRPEICEARFPDLGSYNLPEQITHQIAETKWLVGDAIDDLADIMGDLQEEPVEYFFQIAQKCPPCSQHQQPAGMFKKVVQSYPEPCRRKGRSHFDARSVHLVRDEQGKMARTPLAAFFNIPREGNNKQGVESRRQRPVGQESQSSWQRS